ncbi:MAG: DMT family transporter [Pararhodobacter sp.]|nr:DMT family transporter [Pararhodobacter sp.]
MIRSTALLGALCAIGASAAFTVNDMAVKYLSDDMALHQVIVFRSLVAVAIMLFLIMPLTGGFGQIRTRRPVIHFMRGLMVLAANMCFFMALAAMPIAEATAIFFFSPMVIAVFSVVFLGETVGPWRWGAIFIGFAGVLIIIQPGTSAFSPVSLLPLMAAVFYAALHMMTRAIRLTESAATMGWYIQITFLGASVAVGLSIGDGRFDTGTGESLSFLTRAWVWPAAESWPFLALTGLGSAFGGLLISQAYRLCEAAMVAPLEYIAMPMAILWGFLVFGEWPEPVSWLGMALILGSGLLMIWRETTARTRA